MKNKLMVFVIPEEVCKEFDVSKLKNQTSFIRYALHCGEVTPFDKVVLNPSDSFLITNNYDPLLLEGTYPDW